jgi:hypothetical protein
MDFSLPFLNLDTTNLDREDSPLETMDETSDIDAIYMTNRAQTSMFSGTYIPEMISSYALSIRRDHLITTPVKNWIVIDGANVFYRNGKTGQLGNSFNKFLTPPKYRDLKGKSQVVIVISSEAYDISFNPHMERNFTDFLNIFSEVVTISPPGVEPVQTVRAPVVVAIISLLRCRGANPKHPCLRRHNEKKENPNNGKEESVCSIVTFNPSNRPESSRRTTPYSRPQTETPKEHKWCEFDDIVAAGLLAHLNVTSKLRGNESKQILFTHEDRLQDEANGSKYMEIVEKLREMGPQATVKLLGMNHR